MAGSSDGRLRPARKPALQAGFRVKRLWRPTSRLFHNLPGSDSRWRRFMRATWCLFFLLLAAGAAAGQDSNFSTGPQYLMNYGSPVFMHSISTPELSWQSPQLTVGASDATSTLTAGAENSTANTLPQAAPPADLYPVYYGYLPLSEVSLQGYEEESSLEGRLPASILDVGTWQGTTVEGLRERGYGVSLVEAAGYWKTHVRHATRVYGNADIERLHQSN